METADINNSIIDGYLGLLKNLNSSYKLDLISKLKESIKVDTNSKKSTFQNAFGAFETSKSAEEIIEEIRNSRVFNREIESF